MMGEQYFKDVLAGYHGADFTSGPLTEWQIDIIKETSVRLFFVEACC